MRARMWQRDGGLQSRMIFVYFMLAAIYGLFIAVMFQVGVPVLFIALFSGGMLLVQYFLSDKMVLASMGAHEVTPAQAPDLHGMIGRLAQQMDLPMPKVAIMETAMLNAFATGRNPKNSVVVVTTGIMNRLNAEELEAVIGHELSHVKNRDVQVITIASFFSTIASFIVQWGFYLSPRRDDRNGGSFAIAYLASIVTWALSFLLIRALSRYRELAADRGAAYITGAPSHLMSALQKISGSMARIPQEDLRRVQGANAFFICPALSGESVMNLFSTHPKLETRIAQLQKLQREMEGFH